MNIKQKLLLGGALSVALISTAYADSDYKRPILNKVAYTISAESWVKSDSAVVTVSVNASLKDGQMATIHQDVLNKLSKIADGDWHITQFNRNESQSGLEQVGIVAEVRLADSNLADIPANAKKVSEPGETYKVENVEFKPSLAQVEKTRDDLRVKIYKDIAAQQKQLNSVFDDQHYQVNTVNFLPTEIQPGPRVMMNAMVKSASAPNFSVSDKIQMQATVVFAQVLKS